MGNYLQILNLRTHCSKFFRASKFNDFRSLDPVRDATSLVAWNLVKSDEHSERNRVNTGRALLSLDYGGSVVSYKLLILFYFRMSCRFLMFLCFAV